MFDTILVITDRKVLDKQLQNTVSKLEQAKGVVNPVDLNSQQLKEFLEKGKDIIITTIQKFPFVSEVISQLKGNTFAMWSLMRYTPPKQEKHRNTSKSPCPLVKKTVVRWTTRR